MDWSSTISYYKWIFNSSFLFKGGGEFSVKSFFNKRFWRIYPPYIVFLLIFCIWFGVSRIDLNNFILHILLLQNFSRNYVYSINGAYWSLALEAQLYFIYPFFLLLLKKIGINYLLILLIALNLIFSIYEGVCHINPMSDIVFTAFVLKSWVIWGMGAWLSNFYFQNKKIKISFPVVFVFIVGFYVIFFFQVLLHFVYLYVSVFLVYLIASYISTKNSLSKIEVWLSRVGKISYSFYLIHGPLINILRFGLQKHFSFIPINYCTTSIFSFGIIYLISEVSYNYLEKPSIEIGKRFYKKFQSHIL